MVLSSLSISTLITTTKDLLLVLLPSNSPDRSLTHILDTGGGMRLLKGELRRGYTRDYRQHKQGEFSVNMSNNKLAFVTAEPVLLIGMIKLLVQAAQALITYVVDVLSTKLRSLLYSQHNLKRILTKIPTKIEPWQWLVYWQRVIGRVPEGNRRDSNKS